VISANGQMNPLGTAKVVSQVSGLVSDVAFQEGDWVQEGQILFRVDPRPYADALAQAEASLARDTATTSNSIRSAERLAALARNDYATKSSVDSARAIAAANSATLALDRAAIRTAQFNLGNSVIRAPISGRTGGVLIRRGNYVQADPNLALVVINQIDPMLVQFSVPASVFAELQSGGRPRPLPGRVWPTDPGTAKGSTAPNSVATDSGMGLSPAADTSRASARGTLTFVDNVVDTTTGTVRLKAQLENHDGRLWPGQFVFITLQLSVQRDALLIPSQAVELGQQQSVVYVVQADRQVVRRPVALGATVGHFVVVAQGLTEGERVITDGQSRLRVGARVRVVGIDTTERIASVP
jgi:multidrug efflux system membrane fusion protein